MPVLTAFIGNRQADQEYKVIPAYIVSSKPVWAKSQFCVPLL